MNTPPEEVFESSIQCFLYRSIWFARLTVKGDFFAQRGFIVDGHGPEESAAKKDLLKRVSCLQSEISKRIQGFENEPLHGSEILSGQKQWRKRTKQTRSRKDRS